MSFVIRSLPTKSSQLKNKNAATLISFFSSDTAVLYLYGEPGTGKSFAVDMLAKEYGYDVIHLEPPFDNHVVQAASACSLFTNDKKLIIIDVGDSMKAPDLKALAKGYWGESRLVIIGDTYPRASPLRNAFKKQPYKFTAIKFHQFDEMEILGSLTMYAGELGARVSYETLLHIAQESAGDMRAARLSLKALIASRDVQEIKCFLPLSENAYFSNVNKLFSRDSEDVREGVEYFGAYISIQIMRKNLIARMPDRYDLMYLLKMCSELGENFEGYLIQLGSLIGRVMKSKKYLSYSKPTPFEVPDVNVNCSSVKKVLYFRGFDKWRRM